MYVTVQERNQRTLYDLSWHRTRKEKHSVKVNVPAGVEDGQQMRLSGQGEAGSNGGPYGDLYVVFRVEKVISSIVMDPKFITNYH